MKCFQTEEHTPWAATHFQGSELDVCWKKEQTFLTWDGSSEMFNQILQQQLTNNYILNEWVNLHFPP